MRIPLTAAVFASVFFGGCTEAPMSPAQPATMTVPVRLQSDPRVGSPQAVGSESAQHAAAPHNLRTHLQR